MNSFYNDAALKIAYCSTLDFARLLWLLVPAKYSLRKIDTIELVEDKEQNESIRDEESLSESINVNIKSIRCCTYNFSLY